MGKRFETYIAQLRKDAKRFGFDPGELEARISAIKQRRPRKECALVTKRLDQIRAQAMILSELKDEIRRIAGADRLHELIERAIFRDRVWHGRPPAKRRRERGPGKWKRGVDVFPEISGRAHELPVALEEENG